MLMTATHCKIIKVVNGATLAASGRGAGFDRVETEEGESGGCGTEPASLAKVRLIETFISASLSMRFGQ
jgi:hypothetical protein